MTTITEKKVLKQNNKVLRKRTGRGLYSPSQITDMINIDGYIPVASATELDNLRNSVSQTMGAGTDWEGDYTTGLDKKYVQVRDIDLSGFSVSIFNGDNMTYDGNELTLYNVDDVLFRSSSNTNNFKNIIFQNCISTQPYINVSVLSTYTELINIQFVNCSVNTSSRSLGGLILVNKENTLINRIFATKCTITNTTTSGGSRDGILFSYIKDSTAINCIVIDSSVTSVNGLVGGISGSNDTDTVRFVECKVINCEINGLLAGGLTYRNNTFLSTVKVIDKCIVEGCRINGSMRAGGMIAVLNYATIINSYSRNNIVDGGDHAGGIVGWLRYSGSSVQNCFSSSVIRNGILFAGGLIGENNGVVTNSYYDSDTSGQSDTGKGEPRTTKQLQNGTADSFINPDGSIDGTNSSSNAMFTAWNNDIWRFNPKNKYPRLKPVSQQWVEPQDTFETLKINKVEKSRGLYTPTEITDMINNDNYIPVASASELDNLRNTTSQTMGVGTQWEGSYTTGLDKKYVQVRDIDLSSIQPFFSLNDSSIIYWTGDYDGNGLNINNLTLRDSAVSGGSALFNTGNNTNNSVKLSNINLRNPKCFSGADLGAVLIKTVGSNGYVKNCNIYGFQGDGTTTPLRGSIFCQSNYGLIENSNTFNSIITNIRNSSSSYGVFCYDNYNTIKNCSVINSYLSVNTTYSATIGYSAICAVNQSTGIIQNCKSIDNTVIGWRQVGGIVGLNEGLVENCETVGGHYESKSNVNYPQIGGVVGVHRAAGIVKNCKSSAKIFYAGTNTSGGHGGCIGHMQSSSIVENCYSTGRVSSPSIQKGGLVGWFVSGTITNSYYDSDTSGQSDTGKGEPRTTKQLQNGTEDSYINPDGSVDGTSSPANAVYTAWSTGDWRFNPKNKYPRLKN